MGPVYPCGGACEFLSSFQNGFIKEMLATIDEERPIWCPVSGFRS